MRDGAGAGHVRVNWVLGGSVATARTYESAVSFVHSRRLVARHESIEHARRGHMARGFHAQRHPPFGTYLP